MKILLLNPPFKTKFGRFSRSQRSPAITKSGTLYYPIWLCYVAGVLEEDGDKISIIDSCAYEYDEDKTLNLIKEFDPGFTVIDTSTPSINSDVTWASKIKDIFPACFIVLMGTHPSALPEESLHLNNKIDFVAVGEPDYTIRDLVRILKQSDLERLQYDIGYRNKVLVNIDGLAFRGGDGIHINKERESIKKLDELPFVSKIYKKHLDPRRYFFSPSDYPEVQIITSRGCVGKCSFCVYPQVIHKRSYRFRSVENIVVEFEWILNNMPEIREIGIEDDTFTGNQNHVVQFCQELIKRNIRIKWYCNVRADLKYENMVWMKKAGCALMVVGYESACPEILRNVGKRITPEMILQFSKNARRAGLLVHGCFMVGNRGETKQTMEETLKLAMRLQDDTVQFFPLIVYPGTKDFRWAKENGFLTARTYADYVTEDGLHNSVVQMPGMTSPEIREWCNYARRKYYLRPKYIFYKSFRLIKNPADIRRTYKAFKRFVRFLRPI